MPKSSARKRAYGRWRSMVSRCTDPSHPRWKDYGGRGITVCAEWLNFAVYYAATGDSPGPGISIDRIDNDGPYSPDNVRWADWSTQSKNRRPFLNHHALKTHCPQGHPYDEANTSVRWHGKCYGRNCRQCDREKARERRAQRKAVA